MVPGVGAGRGVGVGGAGAVPAPSPTVGPVPTTLTRVSADCLATWVSGACPTVSGGATAPAFSSSPPRSARRWRQAVSRVGRFLRVIYVPDPEPESIFVITAYELRGKPLTAYRRRQRRKGAR